MGIPVWISRSLAVPDQSAVKALSADRQGPDVKEQDRSGVVNSSEIVTALAANSVVSSATSETNPAARLVKPKVGLQAANDLIRDLQKPSSPIAELVASLDEEPTAKVPTSLIPTESLDALDWSALKQTVDNCTACSLHAQRQNTVFGRGNTQAKWLIVGDIPRLQDEVQQQPFSGDSGVLLDAMLSGFGLDANEVYITNLLKCRPALDRSAEAEQAASCLSYLQRQVELLQPELILLMGRDTAQQVLGSELPMARLRQQLHRREGFSVPLVATYHPAYLLKQQHLKAKVWQDLLFARRSLQ